MKKYVKEIVVLALQFFMFYIFPMFAGPTDAMGMVFLMLFATLVLGAVLGGISEKAEKFLYPGLIALLFIPTIPIYYNESALVHSIWYMVVSYIGMFPAACIRLLILKLKKK